MTDKEKVIKGLKRCISIEDCNPESCPYYKPLPGLCFNRLAADALELIEKQQDLIDGMTKNNYLECIVKFQNGVEVGYREELVRCKDCIKRKTNSCLRYLSGMYSEPDDWFCADGEHKEGR